MTVAIWERIERRLVAAAERGYRPNWRDRGRATVERPAGSAL